MLFTTLVTAILLLPAMFLVASSNSTVTKSNKVVTKENMEQRRLSDEGMKFIMDREEKKHQIYNDGTGVITGGIGHVIKPQERHHWHIGSQVPDSQIEQWLRGDVSEAERCVNNWVIPEIGQAAFDALVSLVFNIGCGNFKRSTLLKKLNKGLFNEAADEFARWKFAGGKVRAGLVARRAEEARIFRDSEWDNEIA